MTPTRPHWEQITWLHFHPGFPFSTLHLLLTVPHRLSVAVDEMKMIVLRKVTTDLYWMLALALVLCEVLFALTHFFLTAALKAGTISMSILQSKKLRHR